jgi:hypothetical protein
MADHHFRMTTASVAEFAANIARGDSGAAPAQLRAVLKDLEAQQSAGCLTAAMRLD